MCAQQKNTCILQLYGSVFIRKRNVNHFLQKLYFYISCNNKSNNSNNLICILNNIDKNK